MSSWFIKTALGCMGLLCLTAPVLLLSYPFGNAVGLSVGLNPHGVAAADLNGDGHVDLVTANTTPNNVSVLLGNGNGTFQPQLTFPVQNRPKFVVTGDFNQD